jgi:ribulose-phosphate 3-epimerase
MNQIISPSILNCNFGKLDQEIEMLNNSQADWIHLDVMDGVFVPNISFGLPIVEQVKKTAKKPLDVHLMIVNPDNYIDAFKEAGAETLTVHLEACTHLHRTLQKMKTLGLRRGVSLNPHTAIAALEDIIHDIDMVLLMTVNPGYGGQKFIPHSFEKIKKLRSLIREKNAKTLIQVDGGVDTSNLGELKEAGAEVFVVGSFIFKSPNPAEVIKELKSIR